MQIMLRFGAPRPSVVAWVPRHLLHKYRRWYNIVNRSGGSGKALHDFFNYLEEIKNRQIYTSSCWSFWWTLWQWNDASATAEHHAWEFLNSLYVLLVIEISRPADCDSLMELSRSSTSTNYSRFPEAWLKRRNSCALKYFGVLHLVLSRRKLSCEQFSSLLYLTTFTTHSSRVETGTWWWLKLCPKIRFCVADK